MPLPRFRLALLALALLGCAGRPIYFQGTSQTPIVAPDDVVELTELPLDAARLGRLSARCRPVAPGESFAEASLVDVDCSEQRLRRMMREAAAAHGGDVLAAVHCSFGSSMTCRSIVGRTERRPRVPGAAARGRDVRGLFGAEVLVAFERDEGPKPARAFAEDAVGDLPELPPSHLRLGSVATQCDGCAELAARDALRIAVGRVGGTDAVGVRCQPWGAGQRCAGAAAIAEREPDPVGN